MTPCGSGPHLHPGQQGSERGTATSPRPVVGDADAAAGRESDVDRRRTAVQILIRCPVRDLEHHLAQAASPLTMSPPMVSSRAPAWASPRRTPGHSHLPNPVSRHVNTCPQAAVPSAANHHRSTAMTRPRTRTASSPPPPRLGSRPGQDPPVHHLSPGTDPTTGTPPRPPLRDCWPQQPHHRHWRRYSVRPGPFQSGRARRRNEPRSQARAPSPPTPVL